MVNSKAYVAACALEEIADILEKKVAPNVPEDFLFDNNIASPIACRAVATLLKQEIVASRSEHLSGRKHVGIAPSR